MGRTIDLNAARAARAEMRAGIEPITIKVGEDSYSLPDEMPISLLDVMDSMSSLTDSDEDQGKVPSLLVHAIKDLVGAASYQELVTKHGLTVDDFKLIVQDASAEYGVSLGESSVSPDLSDADSAP